MYVVHGKKYYMEFPKDRFWGCYYLMTANYADDNAPYVSGRSSMW